MKKFLSVMIILSFSISAVIANPVDEIKKDILSMITKTHKSSLDSTKKGIFLKTNHCEMSNEQINELESELLKKEINEPKKLINKLSKIICSKESTHIVIPKDSKDYIQPLAIGNDMYSGSKTLGDWTCTTKAKNNNTEKISMIGIFMTKTQVSLWQTNAKDSLTVWLAPFKVAPSDAVNFEVKYQDNDWKISGLCYSMRL
ncbi:hypothetical protein [Arcobacter sp. YIC-310]|uniref:hypothetical protein n=1 Tax=Arcobacter sp. YIC-310 TaxID=3376632 RepID=UPI003C1BED5C